MLGIAPLAPLLAAGEASQSGLIPPVVILLMCLVAGVGTVLMLPSRSEAPVRKIGGVVVLGAALIVAALLVRAAARTSGGGMGVYFWVFSAIALVGALRVVTHTRPVYSALYFVLTVFATAGLFILLWAEFMAAALVLIYAGAILVTYVFVIMLATTSAAPAAATGARPRDGNGSADTDGDGSADDNGHAVPAPALAGLAEHDAISREPLVAAAIGFALMGILLFVVFDRATEPIRPVNRDPVTLRSLDSFPVSAQAAQADPDALPRAQGATQQLGLYLFQNHLVNLELAGLILTVSMVGAIVIARRRIHSPAPDAAAAATGRGRDVFTAPMTPIDDNPHSIPVYGTDNPRQKAYPET